MQNLCPICETPMLQQEMKNRCVDHCHKTGLIRDVLCRNCNGIEAKIHNLLRRGKRNLTMEAYFDKIVEYVQSWRYAHAAHPERYFIHPLYKTPEEKKALAKKRRKKKAKK